MEYAYEADLVGVFLSALPNTKLGNHKSIQHITEFDYRSGRPDIVFLNQHKQIVCVEAKLSNWRKAMDQAYRNTCFSDYSYILMPENKIPIALNHQQEFFDRSVGICFMTEGKILVALEAIKTKPLLEWLTKRAMKQIKSRGSYEQSGRPDKQSNSYLQRAWI